MIQLIPPERFEKVQQALRGQAREGAPPAANVENAAHLSRPEPFHFRGRTFLVEPISAMDGLDLMQAAARLEALSSTPLAPGQAWDAYRSAYRNIISLLWRMMRPRGARGLLWRLRPNPLRAANYAEVRDAIRFFGPLLTTSSVTYRFQTVDPPRPQTTSS